MKSENSSIFCFYKAQRRCPRLFILHTGLFTFSFYRTTSSLRKFHSLFSVFLLSENCYRHSTYQTMLMIHWDSYCHSAQNACRPMIVVVCNNVVVCMPSWRTPLLILRSICYRTSLYQIFCRLHHCFLHVSYTMYQSSRIPRNRWWQILAFGWSMSCSPNIPNISGKG